MASDMNLYFMANELDHTSLFDQYGTPYLDFESSVDTQPEQGELNVTAGDVEAAPQQYQAATNQGLSDPQTPVRPPQGGLNDDALPQDQGTELPQAPQQAFPGMFGGAAQLPQAMLPGPYFAGYHDFQPPQIGAQPIPAGPQGAFQFPQTGPNVDFWMLHGNFPYFPPGAAENFEIPGEEIHFQGPGMQQGPFRPYVAPPLLQAAPQPMPLGAGQRNQPSQPASQSSTEGARETTRRPRVPRPQYRLADGSIAKPRPQKRRFGNGSDGNNLRANRYRCICGGYYTQKQQDKLRAAKQWPETPECKAPGGCSKAKRDAE